MDRRRSAKLTIRTISDACLLVYHSNRQALSTAQFRRVGQLATVDTCWLVNENGDRPECHMKIAETLHDFFLCSCNGKCVAI